MWKKDIKTILLLLLCMLLWAIAYNMLTSCTKTVQKLVETHDTIYVEHSVIDSSNVQHGASDTIYVAKTDTFIKTDVRHDSIFVKDSVYVREKGDSVYIYKEKWRTKVDIRHDTVFKAKTDTIYQSKTDTLTIYRFIERKDSANHSSSDKEKVVKERRTFAWLKTLGVFVLIFAGIALWLKFRK